MILSSELSEQGYSYAEVARQARSGQLIRIRQGAYLAEQTSDDPKVVHRNLLEATVRQTSTEAVVSHMSAAVMHGLPVWNESLGRVHLTRNRPTGARVRRYLQVHTGALDPDEMTEIDGFRVTSLARTTVDLGRTLTFLKSVPIADAALAAGLEPVQLQGSLRLATGRPGVGAARRMAAFADGHSESVGESVSRVVLYENNVPAPSHLQYEVFDSSSALVGRADFCWDHQRTLGEFDGKVKYGRLLKPGQTASDVLFAEKLREDRLRDLGWQLVRWTWDDLFRPRALCERLERAFARGVSLILTPATPSHRAHTLYLGCGGEETVWLRGRGVA